MSEHGLKVNTLLRHLDHFDGDNNTAIVLVNVDGKSEVPVRRMVQRPNGDVVLYASHPSRPPSASW